VQVVKDNFKLCKLWLCKDSRTLGMAATAAAAAALVSLAVLSWQDVDLDRQIAVPQ